MTRPPLLTFDELDVVENDIIRYIQDNKNVTRKDVTEFLNLSRTKITTHLQNLFSSGILEEVEELESTGGRPARILELKSDFCYVCGIALGATSARISIADFRGNILETAVESISTSSRPEFVFAHILSVVEDLLDKLSIPAWKLSAFGVGVPAPINSETGKIDSPAIIPGWQEFSIHDFIQDRFSPIRVRVENDVDIMAIGEQAAGTGENYDNFIVIKIATGIGCGIICNGELYAGVAGYSGHIGHISIDRNGPVCYCGNIGCLEKIAAGPAMVERALAAIERGESAILAEIARENNGNISTEDIKLAASQGDRVSNDIIVESGKHIGQVLATVVSFFNPGLIIINGGVSLIGPQLLTSIQRTVIDYSLPISTRNLRLQLSEIGFEANHIGSVQLALQQLIRDK